MLASKSSKKTAAIAAIKIMTVGHAGKLCQPGYNGGITPGAIPMPNIAAVLKDEIRRLAKREIKASTSSTKGAVAQYRRDIAKLKRQMQTQGKEIAFLKVQEQKRLGQAPTAEEPLDGIWFSARSVRAQRQRLGLSQPDYAKLVGVSSMTIYNWEAGKSRPRGEQLAALVAVRKFGKREALQKLEMLKDRPRKPR